MHLYFNIFNVTFSIYMSVSEYIFLEGEIPQTVNIPNNFKIILDGSDLSSNFTAGLNMTPQAFIDKLNTDLDLGNELILGEDSYVSVERMKELFPILQSDVILNRIVQLETNVTDISGRVNTIESA